MANLWPENTEPDIRSKDQHCCLRETLCRCEKARMDTHNLMLDIVCTKKVMLVLNQLS